MNLLVSILKFKKRYFLKNNFFLILMNFLDLDESSVEKSSKIRDNPQCQLCKSVIELIEQRVIDIKSKVPMIFFFE